MVAFHLPRAVSPSSPDDQRRLPPHRRAILVVRSGGQRSLLHDGVGGVIVVWPQQP